jgi:hypothetical protein
MVDTIRLEPDSIEIPESIVAWRLGFKGEKTVSEDFRDLLERAFDIVRISAEPLALMEDLPISRDGKGVRIGEMEVPGELALRQLSKNSRATVLLATIGSGVDDRISLDPRFTASIWRLPSSG